VFKNYAESKLSKIVYIVLFPCRSITAWAISGLLVIVNVISGTPFGTFFAVIGISLGFSDPIVAQYVGSLLHVTTGMVAGNIFGQISLFWSRLHLIARRKVRSKE
jgi:hypothetical protein